MRDNKEETKKSAAAEAKRRRMVSGARNNVSFSRALSRAALRCSAAAEGLNASLRAELGGDFFGVGFGDFVAGGGRRSSTWRFCRAWRLWRHQATLY